MSSVDQAVQTQLNNIQKKTGKTLPELEALIQASGLTKHSEIRSMLQQVLGLGYGDAGMLVHHVMKTRGDQQAAGKSGDEVLDSMYVGPKAALRPIHERFMQALQPLGEFEIAPKKGYLSLRRKRQFAMIGPATKTRVELGLNHKSLGSSPRLLEQPAGSMCNYKVKLTDPAEVDEELMGWVKQAYEKAG
jgi:hypothetical protein